MSRPRGGHSCSLLRHWSMLYLPLLRPWRGTRVPEVPERCCVPGCASRTKRPLVLGPLCPSWPLHPKHPFHHPLIGLTPLQANRNASSTESSGVYVIVGQVLMVQLGLVPGVGSNWRYSAPGTTLVTGPNWRTLHPAGTLTSPWSLTRCTSTSTSSASTSSWITRWPG